MDYTLKLFTVKNNTLTSTFFTVSHFHPSITFTSNTDYLMGIHSNEKLLVFSANIRLGWKWIGVTRSLNNSAKVLITTIKSLKVQAREKKRQFTNSLSFLGSNTYTLINLSMLSLKSRFCFKVLFSLSVPITGFEPPILLLWVRCSTTVLSGHN